LYDESIKRIERVNELYNKFIGSYERIATLYEQQFDNIQRMNQKWYDVLSKNNTKMKGASSKAKG
jgi:archaellum component FlaF (FlaF/FlaG flagellin family)